MVKTPTTPAAIRRRRKVAGRAPQKSKVKASVAAHYDQVFQKVPESFLESWQLQLEADARKFGFEVLRMLFLIHGGALIALLAFAGTTVSASKVPIANISLVMEPFAYGLAVTVAAAMSLTCATVFNTTLSVEYWRTGKAPAFEYVGTVLFGLIGAGLMVCSLCLALFGFMRTADEYERSNLTDPPEAAEAGVNSARSVRPAGKADVSK